MFRAIALALLLTGCSVTPEVISITSPVNHPELPSPYRTCEAAWKVLDVEGRAYIAVSYDDNLNLAICELDKERYISELKIVTCQYRQELNEIQCRKETHAKD
jgi:hypothetical protein